MWYGLEPESLQLQAQLRKKGRSECLWDPNSPLLDLPEANSAGTPSGDQFGHGLPSTAQPAMDEIPHRSTG